MQQSYCKTINLFTVRPVLRVSTWCLRFCCTALLIACHIAQAQVAEITADPSFDPGTGADNEVRSLAVQADGKVIVGGDFTTFNGVPHNRIVRLMPDGTIDPSFVSGLGANSIVISLAVQTDGKIIIGGSFTTYNGVPRNHIARLMPNGALDTSFDPGLGASSTVLALTMQADGKVIVAGDFATFNGIPRNRIVRLLPDGTLDPSFDPGLGASNVVNSLALQADGKIVIGGWFTTINGIPRNRIARLTPDGALDPSFDPGLGASNGVFSLALQADGKIVIVGGFTTFNGVPRNGVARLMPDGALDPSFDPGLGANDWVYSLTMQADGKIIIGGDFTTFNGVTRNRIVRLLPDGALDTSFDPGLGANNAVLLLAMQTDGKIIIGGWFASFNGVSRNHIARLMTPFAAGPQVPVPALNIVALMALASMLCLFGRRRRFL